MKKNTELLTVQAAYETMENFLRKACEAEGGGEGDETPFIYPPYAETMKAAIKKMMDGGFTFTTENAEELATSNRPAGYEGVPGYNDLMTILDRIV
jgi:hypothetical protein